MKLLGILGSVTPPGRLLTATRWALDHAAATHGGLETELINLADKRIAFADGRPPEQLGDDTANVIKSAQSADAVIIASPVYRGSITGALKNLLDQLPVEGLAKPVGIIAMGATDHHYLGVDWHLRDILAWFGSIVVPSSAYLASFDFAEGKLTADAQRNLADLADAVLKLTAISPAPGQFLGPVPLAARRR